MKTRLIEATNGPRNWGKFLIGELDHEWQHDSVISPGRGLLAQRGWDPRGGTLLVMDMETLEGAFFRVGGSASVDLEKHKIWVCPLFEPFLAWLYVNFTTIEALPAHVDLPEAEFEVRGYRREGR